MADDEAVIDYYASTSMSAPAYDFVEAFGRDTAAELSFYRALVGLAPTRILELGVGTGRLALPLVSDGHAVTGLDASPAMLSVAERKRQAQPPDVAARLRLVDGDMARFELGSRFPFVLLPYRAFNCLTGADAQQACLDHVHRHLEPGGRAVLDLDSPALPDPDDSTPPAAATRTLITFPFSDKRLERILEASAFDHATQVATYTIAYAVLDADGRVLRRQREALRLRWLAPGELAAMLERSGLRVVAAHGDFARTRPPGTGDQLWIVEPS